jgi:hypothetical protein
MLPRLRIVSHFPGRLRVRAVPFRDAAFGADVAQQIGAEDGVISAEAVSKTGSLLVLYEAAKVQLPWLVQLIVRAGGLEGLEVDHDGKPIRPQGILIREALDRWNGAVVDATKGRLDARTAVPGTLAGLGALKLLFGKWRTPEWYDLMFWSITMFVNLTPPAPPRPEPPDSDDGKHS